MEKEQKDKELLESFTNYCRKDNEFLNCEYYHNSIIIFFKNTISTDTFCKLILIDHNFFVYKNVREDNICLFIYKKYFYVFN
jgi:hypothetical protein